MNASVETILIGLISVSILLMILSFFKKDRVTELEKQLESLTMQVMQENYQLKKRMKLLEEELLGGDPLSSQSGQNIDLSSNDHNNQQEILKLIQKEYRGQD